VFANTRLTVVSGPLMPCRETICIVFETLRIFISLCYPIASNVWCFLQIFIHPQLFNTRVWRRPTAIVIGVGGGGASVPPKFDLSKIRAKSLKILAKSLQKWRPTLFDFKKWRQHLRKNRWSLFWRSYQKRSFSCSLWEKICRLGQVTQKRFG